MRPSAFVLAVFAVVSLNAHAQQCPDIAPYQKPRETIQDLNRIVAPSGIQESYKTKVGGIEHWINVRGHDKANRLRTCARWIRAMPSRSAACCPSS